MLSLQVLEQMAPRFFKNVIPEYKKLDIPNIMNRTSANHRVSMLELDEKTLKLQTVRNVDNCFDSDLFGVKINISNTLYSRKSIATRSIFSNLSRECCTTRLRSMGWTLPNSRKFDLLSFESNTTAR